MKYLRVYLGAQWVGMLTQDDQGRMRFQYDDAWLGMPDAIPLSWSLPLRESVFPPKACQPFFAGLLPEASNRTLIAGIFGISANNDFAMLERLGGECAGAVTLLPEGASLPVPAHDPHVLSESALADVLRMLPRYPLLAGQAELRLSLAGAQHKMAVCVDAQGGIALPSAGSPSTHILKPANDRFPNVVSNEALCLTLAKNVGLKVVDVAVGQAQDIAYLLVKRYDRESSLGDKAIVRLHQEDFCQALGVPPDMKYQNEGGPGLKSCFHLIKDASSIPASDIQHLLDWVLFNVMVGNHDAHGKNFSLLYACQAGHVERQMAPAYDVLSTVYYPELTEKMAMRLGREYQSSRLLASHFDRFAKDVGLGQTLVRQRVQVLGEKIRAALPGLQPVYPQVSDLVALIDARVARILSVI